MFLGIDKIESTRLAAIDDRGQQITYGELAACPAHLQGVIPPRSVVFLLCRNTVGGLAAYISMIENGIVPVTLNSAIDRELFDVLFDTYRPQYICLETEQAERYDFEIVHQELGFAYLSTKQAAYPIHEDLQLLMTTSGSTGSPKLVRYKKGNLEANAKNVAKAWNWTSEERPVCDLQMNYTMGLNVINTHLYVGATLLLVTRNITDGAYWKFIKENEATNFTGVPFSYDLLWKLRFPRMDLPHMKTLSEGGGKLTDEMFTVVAEYCRSSGKRFIASFGTTETSARMAMLESDMALEKLGSVGKAIPEGELVLFDEAGNEIQQVEAEGELGYRGPNVTMGYAQSIADLALGDVFGGLYRTGDVARRDADGYYYIVGRKSRFLKMLGYRVSLDQCENLIREKFKIDCACGGTDAKMKVFITDPENSDSVKRFISEKTGIYSSMFEIVVVDEILRNSTGKILYKQLEKQ